MKRCKEKWQRISLVVDLTTKDNKYYDPKVTLIAQYHAGHLAITVYTELWLAYIQLYLQTSHYCYMPGPINCFPHTLSPPGATHGDLAKSVSNERCDHAKVAPNIDLLSGNECYMALPI